MALIEDYVLALKGSREDALDSVLSAVVSFDMNAALLSAGIIKGLDTAQERLDELLKDRDERNDI